MLSNQYALCFIETRQICSGNPRIVSEGEIPEQFEMDMSEILAFMKKNRISESEIFDARGLSRSEYIAVMEREGKVFALNADPCKNGHTLRIRSGHCVICDTSVIHHYRIWFRTAYVYVAGSISKRVLKIGTSNNPKDRVRRLNSERYGGANDWILLLQAFAKDSGSKEKEVQKRLISSFVKSSYFKNGKTTETYELVDCSILKAQYALTSTLSKGEKIEAVAPASTRSRYEFTL